MEHIFHGNLNGRGNASGYHKENIMSKATVSNVGRVDSNGIYEATINIDGHTKNSSFFPKSWNRVDVLNSIKEARSEVNFNVGSSNAGWYQRNDRSGIPIRMWIRRDGLIDSAFPIHEDRLR